MADVAETVIARGRLSNVALRYVAFEAIVSTDDTVTLGELSGITISGETAQVSCWRLDTGLLITVAGVGNVVTISEAALANVPIVGLATGY